MANTLQRSWIGVMLACFTMLLAACSNQHGQSPSDDPEALSPEQRAALPEDCLLALHSGADAFCYSPSLSALQRVLRDGSVIWLKQIEDDASSLKVSSIILAGDKLLMVISYTDDNGLWKHALRPFASSAGTTLEPIAILEPLRELDKGGRIASSWNVDGEKLGVTSDGKSLFVTTSVYTRLPYTLGTRVEHWLDSESDALIRIDLSSGERLAYHHFSATVAGNPHVLANGDVHLLINEISHTYDPNTLLDRASVATEPTLRRDSVPLLMPAIYAWADGSRTERIRSGVLAVMNGAGLPEEPSDPPCLGGNGENQPGCAGELTTGPLTIACPVSGTAIHTVYKANEYSEDTGVQVVINQRTVLFDGCRVHVSGNPLLADGDYSVSGEIEIDGLLLDRNRTLRFVDVVLGFPDAHDETLSGRIQETTYLGSNYSQERTIAVDSATSDDEFVSDLLMETSSSSTHGGTSASVQGTLSWRGTLTNNEILTLAIEPTLLARWPNTLPGTGTPDGSRITMSGALAVNAADGSALSVSIVDEPTGTGSYLLRYNLPGEGIVYEEPFESLLVPFLAD